MTTAPSAKIFLDDIADFPGMNDAWSEWIAQGTAPARATVQATLAKPDGKVEIMIHRCRGVIPRLRMREPGGAQRTPRTGRMVKAPSATRIAASTNRAT